MLSESGQVRYDDLENHLGTSALPNEDVMRKLYDTDHNGLYSKQELAKAFGVNLCKYSLYCFCLFGTLKDS